MSRSIVSLVALGSLALAACAPQPDEQQQALDQAERRAELAAQPAPTPPAAAVVDAAACDPVQAQWLVGKTPTEAEIEQARTDAGAQSVRSLKPDQVVTMEFNATRLNLDVDGAGAVVSVRCG
jgi:hypothetical protein